jgi:hypothetical protein
LHPVNSRFPDGTDPIASEEIADSLHLYFQFGQSRTARHAGESHEFPPGSEKLHYDPAQMSEREELAASIKPMVVMHGDLDDPAVPVLKLFHHLYADHAAIVRELDLLEETPSEESEIAVDILDVQPEQEAHKALIDGTNDNPVPGVRPADLVPVYRINATPECLQQQRQFFDIILAIPIGIENQIFGAIRETGNKSGAISSIDSMMNDLEKRVFMCQSVQQFACSVR